MRLADETDARNRFFGINAESAAIWFRPLLNEAAPLVETHCFYANASLTGHFANRIVMFFIAYVRYLLVSVP